MTFDEIKELIAQPLSQVQSLCTKEMVVDHGNLAGQVCGHASGQSGKQLRPLLVLLSASACQACNDQAVTLAAAMELLHTATLIHDDVVDESDLRRGAPTVNRKWSNKVAVLAGDYYLAHVMHLLHRADNREAAVIVNQAVDAMCLGELRQQEVCLYPTLSREAYEDIIGKKTASLIEACCLLGSLDGDDMQREALRRYGRLFGMAFQICDDINDLFPDCQSGKPCGNDIKERKLTLPLICYFEQHPDEFEAWKHAEAGEAENEAGEAESEALRQAVACSNAVDLAQAEMERYIDQAVEALSPLQSNEYTQALKNLPLLLAIRKNCGTRDTK